MRPAGASDWGVGLWQAEVRHLRLLIERIIAQSERRAVAGEQAPLANPGESG